ncbi:MAG: bifunctional 3-deoxy-7-phosphoheptulonate synthase/chorismate mutase type II [Cyclobacteriaceae bacterium]|nr:bifunctional 3-deoxy-7-phosphoheptulonate synthase/chorismate mutase type II [Cyclobacteriaceae bacterium]
MPCSDFVRIVFIFNPMNLSNWNSSFGPGPLFIAGPCSAESLDQLLQLAVKIKALGITVMRAGVWKPRTRPGAFEGRGATALKWLAEVKQHTGLAIATEVVNPQHVEKACEAGIDIVWIGARTTVNPFSVQEIAEALKGTDKIVWVKNPLNPDLSLWLGAIERINRAGINRLAAIHRGFTPFRPARYRNLPLWQMPLELKSLHPQLPLIADPSHIAGERSLVFEVAQRALDLGYDGLMIETHPEPDKALSDARQQLAPEALEEMVHKLRISKTSSENVLFMNQLEKLREQIDHIDRELIDTLAARMRLAEKIGEYKKENHVAVFQPERWKEIMNTRPEWGEHAHLSADFIRDLYRIIHDESIRLQTQIFNQSEQHDAP